MNIVVIGAGSIGLFLATLLSEKNNIILIDKDSEKISAGSQHLDIAARQGSGTDWQLLDELLESKPDLLVAVTNNDEVNLTACMLARQLGYPRTICRVKDYRFLNRSRIDFARLFNIDFFICPELLVALDIYRHILLQNSVEFQSFAHGALQLRTLLIPHSWTDIRKPLRQFHLPSGIMVGLIMRKVAKKEEIILPRGDDCIFPGDEVVFLGEPDAIAEIPALFGIPNFPFSTILIIGGSAIGIHLAKLLKDHPVEITLIDSSYSQCQELARELSFCRVIHHEGIDMDFLLNEKIAFSGFVVASSSKDEANVLSSLMVKKAGCEHVAVVLSDDRLTPLTDELGFVRIISPHEVAAEQIISLASSHTITSLISLYDHQVEIIEIIVTMNCKLIGIPLADTTELLPRNLLIVMIQNRGRTTIAKGDSVICPGDTLILMCPVETVKDLHRIF